MNNLGDFIPGAVIEGFFNTQDTAGAPITLGGTPSLAVYKNNSDVEDTGDITLTVDFDSVTGLHRYRIDTGPDTTFYALSNQYTVVIAAGTVDSISVAGKVVSRFTLGMQTAPMQIPSGVAVPSMLIASSGMLSGTHSATTADLGANAPAGDIVGMTLFFPSHKRSVTVAAYNTGTGVVTFDAITETLVDGNVWVLFATPLADTDLPVPATLSSAERTAVAAAVRVELATEMNNLDEAVSTRASSADLAIAQSGIDNLPTNAELATALAAADDAVLAAVAAVQSDTDNIQTRLPASLNNGFMRSSVDAGLGVAWQEDGVGDKNIGPAT